MQRRARCSPRELPARRSHPDRRWRNTPPRLRGTDTPPRARPSSTCRATRDCRPPPALEPTRAPVAWSARKRSGSKMRCTTHGSHVASLVNGPSNTEIGCEDCAILAFAGLRQLHLVVMRHRPQDSIVTTTPLLIERASRRPALHNAARHGRYNRRSRPSSGARWHSASPSLP
jgi:hypothetical protein